jgi:hypothetical protein
MIRFRLFGKHFDRGSNVSFILEGNLINIPVQLILFNATIIGDACGWKNHFAFHRNK